MILKPTIREANEFFQRGSIALARVEEAGIRIDTDYLNATIQEVGDRISVMEDGLKDTHFFDVWRKRFGAKTSLGSLDQLADVLYKEFKYPCESFTKTGKPSTDQSALEKIDHSFIKDFVRYEKFKKLRSTYLFGVRNELEGGFLHPFFSLNTVRTYRSSSDSPNFQNIPVRDPEIGAYIRRCFIARSGRHLLELDFKGIEVLIAACYHHDPVLIRDALEGDMHRDSVAKCFKLSKEQVSKKARYCGKNMFVFPQFYGDYYLNNARSLWEAMERMNLKVEGSDVTIREHLAKNGITELGECNPKKRPRPGTFEHHIQEVQEDFWARYHVYADWKKKWYQAYLNKGSFEFKTGFRVEGYYKRNDVVNYPIQGSAFHCLLWCLIYIEEWLRERKMKTKIVGQIHDSQLLDVPENELEEVLVKVRWVMTQGIRQAWKWVTVPLSIEAELCPIGGSWFDKKELDIAKFLSS